MFSFGFKVILTFALVLALMALFVVISQLVHSKNTFFQLVTLFLWSIIVGVTLVIVTVNASVYAAGWNTVFYLVLLGLFGYGFAALMTTRDKFHKISGSSDCSDSEPKQNKLHHA